MTVTKIAAAVGGVLTAAMIALSPVTASAQDAAMADAGFEGSPLSFVGTPYFPAGAYGAPVAVQRGALGAYMYPYEGPSVAVQPSAFGSAAPGVGSPYYPAGSYGIPQVAYGSAISGMGSPYYPAGSFGSAAPGVGPRYIALSNPYDRPYVWYGPDFEIGPEFAAQAGGLYRGGTGLGFPGYPAIGAYAPSGVTYTYGY